MLKELPLRDAVWLHQLKTLPCEVCDIVPSDPAHIREGVYKAGGKPADDLALPLCRPHHNEQHNIGERPFWRKYLTRNDGMRRRMFGDRRVPIDGADMMAGVKAYARNLYAAVKGKKECAIF